jgi:hypothetical protein
MASFQGNDSEIGMLYWQMTRHHGWKKLIYSWTSVCAILLNWLIGSFRDLKVAKHKNTFAFPYLIVDSNKGMICTM